MFSAILLAGGRSSRMGHDKKLMVYRGQTLLQRALELLQSSGARQIYLSGAQRGGYERAVMEVPDLLPQAGPPGGIYACLHYLQEHGRLDDTPLLVMPVDMPLLQEGVLRGLIDKLDARPACHYQDEIFPCVIRASLRLHDFLAAAFAEGSERGGKRSMRSIFDFLDALELPYQGDRRVFSNINTPEDWAALA